MHVKLLLALSLGCTAIAAEKQLNQFELNFSYQDSWDAVETDSSFIISSKNEIGGSTVLLGVQFKESISPSPSEENWRTNHALATKKVIEANDGIIFNEDINANFLGEKAIKITYLGLEYQSLELLAGYSLILAHNNHGYEFFIAGDTTAIYQNIEAYESILDNFSFMSSSSSSVSSSSEVSSSSQISSSSNNPSSSSSDSTPIISTLRKHPSVHSFLLQGDRLELIWLEKRSPRFFNSKGVELDYSIEVQKDNTFLIQFRQTNVQPFFIK